MTEEIKIPTDFLLDRWSKVVKYDFTYEGTYNEVIYEGLDLPEDFIKELNKESKEYLINLIFNICYPSDLPIKKDIQGNKLVNFNQMSFGLFVDLEILFSKGLEENIKKIVQKLYNTTIDKYITIGEVYPSIISYLNFRTLIYNKYKNLFALDKYEFFKDDLEEKKPVDPAYVWFDMLMVLADGKFLNIEEVTNKPLISALNFLAWTKEKLEIEQKNIKNELQRHSRSY